MRAMSALKLYAVAFEVIEVYITLYSIITHVTSIKWDMPMKLNPASIHNS